MTERRPIPATQLTIDSDGFVYNGDKRLPTATAIDEDGIKQLAVHIEDQLVPVWKLLQPLWYDGHMILPRDGNALNWRRVNTVILPAAANPSVIKDTGHILYVWCEYCRGTEALEMYKATGLPYFSFDYATLIAAVQEAIPV